MDDIESETHNTFAELLVPPASAEEATKVSLPLPSMIRSVHIPYILNGELYEIQTQEGENVTVKCCHCPPDRVYRGSVRSTGNFHMHIKRRHPDLLGKLHDMKVNALLERRDRLMKNRKLTYRSFNKRSSSTHNASTTVKRESKFEQGASIVLPAVPKLSLMHTHKFKIRAAYQQHQLQKQEQAQQQQQQHRKQHQQVISNWDIVKPFVVFADDVGVEPLNFSTKEQNVQINMQTTEYIENPSAQQAPTYETNRLQCDKSAPQTAVLEKTSHLNDNSFYEMVTAPNTPCLSSIVSYDSTTSDNSPQIHTVNPFVVIKNENFFSEQALDLSSSSKQDSSISSGIGSTAAETLGRGSNLKSLVSDATKSTATTGFKLDELFLHMESSLQNIQRVMQTRNQIETNRICLDIAKFKYLHPDFNYNYY